jgi:hypothetical protein
MQRLRDFLILAAPTLIGRVDLEHADWDPHHGRDQILNQGVPVANRMHE